VRARLAAQGAEIEELGEGAWVALVPRAIDDSEAFRARLLETLPLAVEQLWIGGRAVSTPRRTSWHGDPGALYAYSGRVFSPAPWTPELAAIRDVVASLTGIRFGSVLVNEYRDGRDSMGWHADDEPALGPDAPWDVLIASVSLGARRRFTMRHRRNPSARREWALGEGDLFVMGGATQRRWQHAVPKTAQPVGRRINLSFRWIRSSMREPGRTRTSMPHPPELPLDP